jgi:hypothetical protein
MGPASMVKATKMVPFISKFRGVKPISKSNDLVFSHTLKAKVVIFGFGKVLSCFLKLTALATTAHMFIKKF